MNAGAKSNANYYRFRRQQLNTTLNDTLKKSAAPGSPAFDKDFFFCFLKTKMVINEHSLITILSSKQTVYLLLASFILILRPLKFLPSSERIIWLAERLSISIQLFISFISILPSTSFFRSLISRINCRKLAL